MGANETNMQPCGCCGQSRPYPTEPGKWEFCEYPVQFANDPERWVRVDIVEGEEGFLNVIPEGSDEPIWWPSNAAWRQVV